MVKVAGRYDHCGKTMDLMAVECGITMYLPRDVIAVYIYAGRVAVSIDLVKHVEWIKQDITSMAFITTYVDAQRHEYNVIVSNHQFKMKFMSLSMISELIKT